MRNKEITDEDVIVSLARVLQEIQSYALDRNIKIKAVSISATLVESLKACPQEVIGIKIV